LFSGGEAASSSKGCEVASSSMSRKGGSCVHCAACPRWVGSVKSQHLSNPLRLTTILVRPQPN
jgi:hypothetical protein